MSSFGERRVAGRSGPGRQWYAEGGLPVADAKVIHRGVPVERFGGRGASGPEVGAGPVRLLCAGQLVEHKGVHTLLEALALLGPDLSRSVRVSIAGRITPGDPYHERLRGLAAALGNGCVVDFLSTTSTTSTAAAPTPGGRARRATSWYFDADGDVDNLDYFYKAPRRSVEESALTADIEPLLPELLGV